MKFEDFSVEYQKITHTSSSIAYKFVEKEKTLVISGDCAYDERLINFSKDANILLLECSYPNNIKKRGHLIPKECGLIALKAGVKKLVLTHIYPYSSGKIRLDQTKKIFKNTILAEDFMKINI
jgi:ribonuclease BN (tRNA processing enzyme)